MVGPVARVVGCHVDSGVALDKVGVVLGRWTAHKGVALHILGRSWPPQGVRAAMNAPDEGWELAHCPSAGILFGPATAQTASAPAVEPCRRCAVGLGWLSGVESLGPGKVESGSVHASKSHD